MAVRNYDDAELVSHDRLTLAQWARAEAVKAVLSNPNAPTDLQQRMNEIHTMAKLIVTGDGLAGSI